MNLEYLKNYNKVMINYININNYYLNDNKKEL